MTIQRATSGGNAAANVKLSPTKMAFRNAFRSNAVNLTHAPSSGLAMSQVQAEFIIDFPAVLVLRQGAEQRHQFSELIR